jgi:hypothetical protein
MELLEGESLERCLEKCPLALMQALQCGIQIAEALENTDIVREAIYRQLRRLRAPWDLAQLPVCRPIGNWPVYSS